MIQNEKIEPLKRKPLILFSPLDWGLGHTTRSIPLISEILKAGADVIIACNSIQKQVLEKEFPVLNFIDLPGYNIIYGRNRPITRLKLLFSLPNILTKIKSEHSWISEFLRKNTVDGVVSDNRYGLYSSEIPCILITHQLAVQTGSGKWLDRLVQTYLYRWINKFTECWIPDYESSPNISGALGHPEKLPATKLKYLGAISRFEPLPSREYVYDVMILLSGPEPQRTILENTFLKQLVNNSLKVIFIRGLPAETTIPAGNNVRFINYAPSVELNRLICESALVISRSGYTTIMDLLKLGKKMVLIPTPGQTEQEYLATHLSKSKMAISFKQENFMLQQAIDAAKSLDHKILETKMDEYKLPVHEFVSKLI